MVNEFAKQGVRAVSFEAVAPTETDLRSQAFSRELGAVLSALDSVLDDRFALFASAEWGEGRMLYRLLAEAGLSNTLELQEKLGDKEFRRQALDPQRARALELARGLRLRHSEELVITPAHFCFEGWSPQEYRTLWGTVVRTRIAALYFGDDWEYSESSALEFKIAWEIGLPTFDVEGQPLSLSEGRFRIQNAILELDAEGFDTSGLGGALHNLGRQNRVMSINR